MSDDWIFGRRIVQARADVDIEKSPESFHAYAVPDGVDIRPGDIVTVHGVPTDIGFGERLILQCPATIDRAGLIERLWTSFTAFFQLTELYEVGFMPKEAP